MKMQFSLLGSFLFSLSLSGCATTIGSVEVVKAPALCQPPSQLAGARLIPAAEAQSLLAAGDNNTLGGPKNTTVLSAGRYLRVDMGMKPTSGYRLVPLDREVKVSDGAAQIKLDWIKPAADSVTAQVITHPCLVLKLPEGDYQRVELLDATGDLRHSVSILD